MRKLYGVRDNGGVRETVWMESVRNGFWRGIRLPDGHRTRGPIASLIGRYATEAEANAERDR